MKDAFTKIAELIENKKIGVLIIAILVTIILTVSVNYFITNKNNRKITEYISRILGGDENLISDEKDAQINEVLNNLRRTLGANRVYHAVYHNGVVNSDHIGYRRMSIMHESKSQLTLSYLGAVNNIPMSLLSYWNMEFEQSGTINYTDIDSIQNTEKGIYYLLKDTGVRSLYVSPYSNNDGETIGYIGVEYKVPNTLTHDDIEHLERKVGVIRGIVYNIVYRGND